MNKIKGIIVGILAFTMNTNISAQNVGEKFKVNNLYYKITSLTPATAEVTSQHNYAPFWDNAEKPTGNVTVPNTVTYNDNVFSVTAIGECAFDECGGLISISIPANVTSIKEYAFNVCVGLTSITFLESVTTFEKYAFFKCTSLTSINIPVAVTSIGKGAFGECSSLISIDIPAALTSIGEIAFVGCTSLTAINVDTDNTFFSSVDGVLFNYEKTTIIVYPAGKTETSYTIPSSVTLIDKGTFAYCTLTSINIPTSVTSIGNNAFFRCHNLTSITIPSSITSMESFAFMYCTGLNSIISQIADPDSVALGLLVFYGIPKGLEENPCALYVPEGSLSLYQNAEQWQDFMPNMFTGMEDVVQSSVVIYPNPTSNTLNIKSDTPIYSFELYDALGRLIQNKTEMFSTENTVDVSSLSRGIYFVRLHTANGTVEHKVIIDN